MNSPMNKSVKLGGSAVIAVPKNTAVYTDAIDISGLDGFTLSYKLACTGSPSVDIEMEQSVVGPAVENIADANFVTPDTINKIGTAVATKTQHHAAIAPVTIQYIRFKLTEKTNSVTDTVATLFLSGVNRHPQV